MMTSDYGIFFPEEATDEDDERTENLSSCNRHKKLSASFVIKNTVIS
jgi:hypothetical protein